MDYARYTAQQFAQDEAFQAWVLHPRAADELFWQQWLDEHPHRRAKVEQAQALLLGWQFEAPPVSDEEVAHLRRNVMRQVNNESRAVAQRRVMYRVAASLLILLGVAGVLYRWVPFEPDWVNYQTDYGEIKTFQLPDGSEVTLNANSTLRFAPDWKVAEYRQVWLRGEAYFNVAKQALTSPPQGSQHVQDGSSWKKFLVKANDLEVAVVGTQFNVYARARTEVVLEEGAVSVRVDSTQQAPSALRQMKPGERLTYAQQSFSQQQVNPASYTSWRKRQLVFDAVPLLQVAQKIKETYGVDVVFTDPLLTQQTFTGTVPSSNLTVLLEALTGIYQLKITQQEDQIIIQPKITSGAEE